MQGHLDAARQRDEPPPEQRVYWFFDEAQIYDGASVSPRAPPSPRCLSRPASTASAPTQRRYELRVRAASAWRGSQWS